MSNDESRQNLLGTLGLELRQSTRSVLRTPLFAATVVLVLGLGIAVATTAATLVNGILLEPLPYNGGDRLAVLEQSSANGDRSAAFSIPEFFELRDSSRSFDSLVEYHPMSFTLLGRSEPIRVSTGVVSHDFFQTLGLDATVGRTFQAEDETEGAEAVLVLGHDFWLREFGGRRDVVGEAFQMNDRAHTVVGVLPPIPQFPNEHDVYMPTVACPFRGNAQRNLENRNAFRALTVFGRLKEDATLDAARSELAAAAARFENEHPNVYAQQNGVALSADQLQERLVREARPALLLLAIVATLVLLIASANVANLFVARMMRRRGEFQLRAALGAARSAVLRIALYEGLLLALLGGVLGTFLARVAITQLSQALSGFTPRADQVGLGANALVFAGGLALFTGLLIAALCALGLRRSLASGTRGSAGAGDRAAGLVRQGLIAVQVAVSVVLLVSAGLVIRSLEQLQEVDLGFDPSNVTTAEVLLNWSRYPSPAERLPFVDSVLTELRSRPGVELAAAGYYAPFQEVDPSNSDLIIEGVPIEDGEALPQIDFRSGSTDYFATLGIPLLAGRTFEEGDRLDADRVAIVNQALVDQLFDGREPLGRRISFNRNSDNWLTIVGVVGDIRRYQLESAPQAAVYMPTAQGGPFTHLMVRGPIPPADLAQALKRSVRAVDPQQPVADIQTLIDRQQAQLGTPRLTARLLSGFSAVALLLAATGLAGLCAYTVAQRRREIGLRLALGASRPRVVQQVLTSGLLVAALGGAIGLAGSLFVRRALDTMLFEVAPFEPWVIAGTLGVLMFAIVFAMAAPALRATRVPPTEALRTD